MAKEKSPDKQLKRLHKQLKKHVLQPSERNATRDGKIRRDLPIVLTRRGRIENKIKSFKNSKK